MFANIHSKIYNQKIRDRFMPMVYQHNINASTKLGVWHIAEPEAFFLAMVPVQREISHPHKRLQHLAGRYLLKELFPGFPYDLIRIADTKKPFLENEAYHFSISHCGDYAAVIVSTQYRVGVDVELIAGKAEKVKHKFLSAIEQQLLEEVPYFPYSIFCEKLLTAAWSIKESLFKWQGAAEVDFRKHLQIHALSVNDNEGVAQCIIARDVEIDLPVNLLFFNKNCISWVVSHI
ncbi:MAG: 4-phosphopantetheinyl transferase superfamily protein [Ferruginibacter sp.]|nr:4-phosphopantetheinyl transferase superfamily protein [Ferruginibacter sp.]